MIAVIEPATEAVLEELPRAGIDEVDAAVARAERGVPGVAGDRARGSRIAAPCARRRACLRTARTWP